jgi:hypothetical protein
MTERMFVALLRRPEGVWDRRDDPFWEFGSFGLTGCHRDNLLHPVHTRVRDGDRLAFIQGGALGSRLLLLTPPVTLVRYRQGTRVLALEARWDPRVRPFAYGERAPLVSGAGADAPAELPGWRQFLSPTRRSTAAAKLSSRFRARSEPLSPELANELLWADFTARASAPSNVFTQRYVDAVPGIHPSFAGVNRRQLYRSLRQDLRRIGFTPDVKCRRRCVLRRERVRSAETMQAARTDQAPVMGPAAPFSQLSSACTPSCQDT